MPKSNQRFTTELREDHDWESYCMYKMKTFMKSKSRRNKYVLCNKVHPLLGKLKCRHPKCNLSLLQHVKDRYGKSSPIPLLLHEYGEAYGINVTNNDYMFMESCETTSQNQSQPVLNGQSFETTIQNQTQPVLNGQSFETTSQNQSFETTSQNQTQPVLNGQSSKCTFISQTYVNVAVNLKMRETKDQLKTLVLIKSKKNENLQTVNVREEMMASWFELDKVAAEKDVAEEEALKLEAEAEAKKRQKKKKQKSSLLLLLKRKRKPLM